MNCENAKKIKLTSILQKMGVRKTRSLKNENWYLSPFRKERTASFKVNIEQNIFYDFGEGFGGTVLEFIMRYYHCDIKEALQILGQEFDSFSFCQQEVKVSWDAEKEERSYIINEVKILNNPTLIQYLKSRKLDLEICNKYLCEVNYQINDKKYFGIGFKNDQSGFEIRNKYVKLCLGRKWFTHIKNESGSVVILESWSDFISILILYPKIEILFDFVILNSLSILTKLDSIIDKYGIISLALDKDEAGVKATEKCMQKWKGRCKDISYLYPAVKDINEFLMQKKNHLRIK